MPATKTPDVRASPTVGRLQFLLAFAARAGPPFVHNGRRRVALVVFYGEESIVRDEHPAERSTPAACLQHCQCPNNNINA